MKKILLLSFVLFFSSGCLNAQVKKAAVRNNSKTVSKQVVHKIKTNEQIIIEKAQAWFKEKYVETTFKDPYSYRVVGVKAVSKTHKEWLDDEVIRTQKKMDDLGISPSDNPYLILAEINESIRKCEIEMDKNKNNQFYYKFKDIRDDCKRLARKAELYIDLGEYLKHVKEMQNDLSTETLNSSIFYEIHLDCYSKNELGNEVLGRFLFPFTKDGAFKNDDTTLQMVEKIN